MEGEQFAACDSQRQSVSIAGIALALWSVIGQLFSRTSKLSWAADDVSSHLPGSL
jgi:hypothetical protein